MGVVRVGTLYDFRRSEHRAGISDPQEGKKVVQHHIESVAFYGNRAHSAKGDIDIRAIRDFGVFEGTGEGIHFRNISVSRPVVDPDCYVFCMCLSNSKNKFKSFDGTDFIVEILHASEFIRCLNQIMSSTMQADSKGIFRVQYRSRLEPWNGNDWGVSPVTIKEPEYSDQEEIRAVWIPRNPGPIAPIITGGKQLVNFCRVANSDA
jgi:hypothetical protein